MLDAHYLFCPGVATDLTPFFAGRTSKGEYAEALSQVLGEQVHYIHTYWWNRIVPLRSYVHGWKIGPSHYTNQDLSTIWLAPPKCGECSAAAPNREKHADATVK